MLKGAMEELAVGNPDRLSTDIGPVISAEARDGIAEHVAAMRMRGHPVNALPLPPETQHGTFVAPTIIEIGQIADVEREVFGPVLHVLRYRRETLDALIEAINASGYGLTFGLHTRIDETISRVVNRIEAGNVYVNRNIIGATVGVQPFGGSGLSGTGPKAGGPLYLGRLLGLPIQTALRGLDGVGPALATARAYVDWLRGAGHETEAERVVGYLSRSALGGRTELVGPVGERNVYALRPRGQVAALARTGGDLLAQVGAILATGNMAIVERDNAARHALSGLPPTLAAHLRVVDRVADASGLRAILFDGEGEELIRLNRRVAERDGPIVSVQSVTAARFAAGDDLDLDRLLDEVSVSTNTAAAGGNASLMSLDD
jgi:RHH-type proline utilization regulon transcriptional repressor/proline dehydrogenase/delta 1-pyrroline-5-carboxylate dehydrogenase